MGLIEFLLNPQFLSILAMLGTAAAWVFQITQRSAEVEKIKAETAAIHNAEWERLYNEVRDELIQTNARLDRANARIDSLEQTEIKQGKKIEKLEAQNKRLHNNLKRAVAQLIENSIKPNVDQDFLGIA